MNAKPRAQAHRRSPAMPMKQGPRVDWRPSPADRPVPRRRSLAGTAVGVALVLSWLGLAGVDVRGVPAAAAEPARSDLHYGKPLPAPPTGRWTFQVYYGEYDSGLRVASLGYSIAHDGRRYQLRSEARAEGLTALIYSGVLSQSSTGRLSSNGLEPEHYTEKRGRREPRSAEIDRARRQVVLSGNAPVPLVEGAQDRLSILVQLGLLARATPERFAKGAVVQIPEISHSRIEQSSYAVRGDAVLETESGPLRTLHMERTAPRKKDDNRIEVWLGYDHGMLPVRLRVTDTGGRVLDQILAR